MTSSMLSSSICLIYMYSIGIHSRCISFMHNLLLILNKLHATCKMQMYSSSVINTSISMAIKELYVLLFLVFSLGCMFMQGHLPTVNVFRWNKFSGCRHFSVLLFKKIYMRFVLSFCHSLQTNVGSKSHAVVMPDANIDATLNALVSAGFGSAVQRFTAISTIIFVGGSNSWYVLKYLVCLLLFILVGISCPVMIIRVRSNLFQLCYMYRYASVVVWFIFQQRYLSFTPLVAVLDYTICDSLFGCHIFCPTSCDREYLLGVPLWKL